MPQKVTECWYCHGHNLEADKRGTVCKDCGATDSNIPKVGPPIVEPGNIFVKDGVDRHAKHPTRSVARKAARARG